MDAQHRTKSPSAWGAVNDSNNISRWVGGVSRGLALHRSDCAHVLRFPSLSLLDITDIENKVHAEPHVLWCACVIGVPIIG